MLNMFFDEAFMKLRLGKSVKRNAQPISKKIFMYQDQRTKIVYLCRIYREKLVPVKKIDVEDLLADDWEVVEEDKK